MFQIVNIEDILITSWSKTRTYLRVCKYFENHLEILSKKKVLLFAINPYTKGGTIIKT